MKRKEGRRKSGNSSSSARKWLLSPSLSFFSNNTCVVVCLHDGGLFLSSSSSFSPESIHHSPGYPLSSLNRGRRGGGRRRTCLMYATFFKPWQSTVNFWRTSKSSNVVNCHFFQPRCAYYPTSNGGMQNGSSVTRLCTIGSDL